PAPHLRKPAAAAGRIARVRAATARTRVDSTNRRHLRQVAIDGQQGGRESARRESGSKTVAKTRTGTPAGAEVPVKLVGRQGLEPWTRCLRVTLGRTASDTIAQNRQ